jgi:antagonist of KipI
MSSGVPQSGAMDVRTLSTLNVMLGNTHDAAGMEIALTGCELEFSGSASFAFGGATATISRNGEAIDEYRVHRASEGDVITIGAITRGRFVYLAVAGGFEAISVMGSRSTYLPGAFGGRDGRRLKNGDELRVGEIAGNRRHHVTDALPDEFRPHASGQPIRFVPRESMDGLEGLWSVSASSDRTGYRLAGAALKSGGSIVSQPVCPGVIQVPPGGEPIVLMADAPTVGGYRIAGAVISADLGALAQLAPGESFRLEAISVEAAQREIVARSELMERISEWSLIS